MQFVTFVNNQNQPVATFNMDVPRVGDSVVLNSQPGVVQAVRYFLYPQNNTARAVVLVVPQASPESLLEHYNALAEGA
ncbi:MAG: hypothetical protein H0X25_03435 [Acidobacteriales bacterium]|nr:hypothetical protein [Terriglobales bacterium]